MAQPESVTILRSRGTVVGRVAASVIALLIVVLGLLFTSWLGIAVGLVVLAESALVMRIRLEIRGERIAVQNALRRHELALSEVAAVEPGFNYGMMIGWAPRLRLGDGRSVGVSAYAPMSWTASGRRAGAAELAAALGVRLVQP